VSDVSFKDTVYLYALFVTSNQFITMPMFLMQ
jgi:hypothetical protein